MENKDLIKILEEQNSLLIEEQKELKEHLGHKYGEKQSIIIGLSDTIRENIKTIIGIKKYNLDNASRSIKRTDGVRFEVDNVTYYAPTEKSEKENNELDELEKDLATLKDLRNDLNTFTSIESKEEDIRSLDFAINLITNNTPDVKEAVKKALANRTHRIEGKDDNRAAEIMETIIYKFKNKKIKFSEAIKLINYTNIVLAKRKDKINTNNLFDKITEAKHKNPMIKEIIDTLVKEDITYIEAEMILEYVISALNYMSSEYLIF